LPSTLSDLAAYQEPLIGNSYWFSFSIFSSSNLIHYWVLGITVRCNSMCINMYFKFNTRKYSWGLLIIMTVQAIFLSRNIFFKYYIPTFLMVLFDRMSVSISI